MLSLTTNGRLCLYRTREHAAAARGAFVVRDARSPSPILPWLRLPKLRKLLVELPSVVPVRFSRGPSVWAVGGIVPPARQVLVCSKTSFGFRLRAAERSLAASRPSPQSRPAFVGRDGAPASVPGWFFRAHRLPFPFPFPCLLPSGGPAAPSPLLPAPSVTLPAGGARGGRAGPCFVRWGLEASVGAETPYFCRSRPLLHLNPASL